MKNDKGLILIPISESLKADRSADYLNGIQESVRLFEEEYNNKFEALTAEFETKRDKQGLEIYQTQRAIQVANKSLEDIKQHNNTDQISIAEQILVNLQDNLKLFEKKFKNIKSKRINYLTSSSKKFEEDKINIIRALRTEILANEAKLFDDLTDATKIERNDLSTDIDNKIRSIRNEINKTNDQLDKRSFFNFEKENKEAINALKSKLTKLESELKAEQSKKNELNNKFEKQIKAIANLKKASIDKLTESINNYKNAVENDNNAKVKTIETEARNRAKREEQARDNKEDNVRKIQLNRNDNDNLSNLLPVVYKLLNQSLDIASQGAGEGNLSIGNIVLEVLKPTNFFPLLASLGSFAIEGRSIYNALEQDIKDKNVDALIHSPIVQKILADEGIFEVLVMNTSQDTNTLGKIINGLRDEIDTIISDTFFNNEPRDLKISNESLLILIDKLLSNPALFPSLATILKNNQEVIEEIIKDNPTIRAFITINEINPDEISKLIPQIIDQVNLLAKSQVDIYQVFKALKEMIILNDNKIVFTPNAENLGELFSALGKIANKETMLNLVSLIKNVTVSLKLIDKKEADIFFNNTNIQLLLSESVVNLTDIFKDNKEIINDIINVVQNSLIDGKFQPDINSLIPLADPLLKIITDDKFTSILKDVSANIPAMIPLVRTYTENSQIPNKEQLLKILNNEALIGTATNLINTVVNGLSTNKEFVGDAINVLKRMVIIDEAGVKFSPDIPQLINLGKEMLPVITNDEFIGILRNVTNNLPAILPIAQEFIRNSDITNKDLIMDLLNNENIIKPRIEILKLLLNFLETNKEGIGSTINDIKDMVVVSDNEVRFNPDFVILNNVVGALTQELAKDEFQEQLKQLIALDNLKPLLPLAMGFISNETLSEENKQKILTLLNNPHINNIANDLTASITKAAPVIFEQFATLTPSLNKIAQTIQNMNTALFDPKMDLNSDDIEKVLNYGINVLKAMDLEKVGKGNEAALKEIVSMFTNDKLYIDAAPIGMKIAQIVLSHEGLNAIQNQVVPKVAALIINPQQNLKENLFGIADVFVDIIKSAQFKGLYNDQISPYLKENKILIANLIHSKFIETNPKLKSLNITAENVEGIITNEKLFTSLISAYEAYKSRSYLSMIGHSVKVLTASKDMRKIICGAIIEGIANFIKENLYPGFLRNWLVGNSVNNAIMEATIANDKELTDLGTIFEKTAEGMKGLSAYALINRYCVSLDIRENNLNNMYIEGFNFSNARFLASENIISFKGSKINNTDFSGVEFISKRIDLTNVEIDQKSFEKLLPSLEKALKNGVHIEASNMKLKIEIGLNMNKSLEALKNGISEELKQIIKVDTMIQNFGKENTSFVAKLSSGLKDKQVQSKDQLR